MHCFLWSVLSYPSRRSMQNYHWCKPADIDDFCNQNSSCYRSDPRVFFQSFDAVVVFCESLQRGPGERPPAPFPRVHPRRLCRGHPLRGEVRGTGRAAGRRGNGCRAPRGAGAVLAEEEEHPGARRIPARLNALMAFASTLTLLPGLAILLCQRLHGCYGGGG